jgi:hypothetical protein
MSRRTTMLFAAVVAFLSSVAIVRAQDRPPDGPGSPPIPEVRPLPSPDGAPPVPMLRRQADELRAQSRRAQELADRLRRQADELDMLAQQMMSQGRGPQGMEPGPRPGPLPPVPPGPGTEERQEIKRRIERLRDEAQRAREQGRVEDAHRSTQAAERLEQELRSRGARAPDRPGPEMPPEVQDILRAAEQAEREGRIDEARRQRIKAKDVMRQWQEQRAEARGEERPRMKEQVARMREEAQRAKEQGRFEDAERLWQEADRLEQQLREQGPQGKGEPGQPFREEVMRRVDGLKREMGRLWQTVDEIRSRLENQRS